MSPKPSRPTPTSNNEGGRKELPLKKPVFALGLKPKSGKITLMSRKIWNVLLHKSQQDHVFDQVNFRCPLSEIVQGLNFNSNDLELIKKHLRTLASTTVEWESPTAGESPSWTVCAIISHAKIEKVKGMLWVEWSLPATMREQLLDPDIYARIHLRVAALMSSHAGLALYEICTRYKDVRTARQPWQWWVPVLTGRAEDESLKKMDYARFKRDVLKLAIAEVNAVTDLEVALVEHRQGRNVTDIQFTIDKKSQRSLDISAKVEPVDLALLAAGQALGIDDEQVERLVTQYGEVAVQAGIDATARRAKSAFPEPLRDPLRYLKSTMPGYAAQEVQRQEDAKAKAVEPVASQDSLRAKWAQQWLSKRREAIFQEINGMGAERQAQIVGELVTHLRANDGHPTFIKLLNAGTWTHKLVQAMVVDFYARGAYGEDWAQPSAEDLLDVAAQMSGQGGSTI